MPVTRSLGAAARASLGPICLIVLLALAACSTTPSPSATLAESLAATPVVCGADEVAAGGIRGTAVDPDGNPLNDIFITIETGDGFRGTARTGADGAFTAPGVSGDFTISTVDVAYQSLTQRVSVPCGELVDVELVLTPVDG